MADKVFHGALGIIKVNGIVVGKARNVRCSENFTRQEVLGLGTIIPSEKPVTRWSGSLSCSFMSISFKKDGLPGAIKRIFTNIASQVLSGESSFEDQIVLDDSGITMDIYKKVEDYIDPNTGNIRPKAEKYVSVRNLLIESQSFDMSEGNIVSHDQSFSYLTPIVLLD